MAPNSRRPPKRPKPPTYDQIVREAVKEIAKPASHTNISEVTERLRKAATSSFKPLEEVTKDVHKYYSSIYTRVTKKKKGPLTVPRYTLANLTREAQEELQRKIVSSVELIKLNREVAIADTMRRFVGWASSVPPEGADTQGEPKKITKALKQLPYTERRVIIDQGHKLAAAVEDVVSKGSGAIAAVWHSHVHQSGYDYRKDHAARNDKIYLIRGSWADKDGYAKPLYGFTDNQTMPAEEVNCRCYYQYLFNLKDLPPEMLTQKAKDLLADKKETSNATN